MEGTADEPYLPIRAEDMPPAVKRPFAPRMKLSKAVAALDIGFGVIVTCRPHRLTQGRRPVRYCPDLILARKAALACGVKLRLYHDKGKDGRLCIVREKEGGDAP